MNTLVSHTARGRRGHLRLRRTTTLLVALLSLSLVVTGCDSADLDESVAGTPKSKASSADSLDCGKAPSQEQLRVAKGAGLPTLGAGGFAVETMKWTAEKIGEDLFDFGADEGYGWLLSMLTGKDRKQAETDKKIDETYSNSVALRSQVYDLCTSLDKRMDELQGAVDLKAYQGAVMPLKVGALADLDSYQEAYNRIVKNALADPAYVLDGEDADKIDDIRQNMVKTVMKPLRQAMSNDSDSDGLIGMYADVLGDKFGYRPAPTQEYSQHTWIFTPEYLQAGYDQQNFYGGAMVQALLLYAEVMNLDFTTGTNEHRKPAPGNARDQSTTVVDDLDGWAAQMWNGRGKSPNGEPWINTNPGMIPDGTLADLRVQGKPRVWVTAPYALTGDNSENPPPYCGKPTTWCWAELNDGQGNVLSRTTARPVSGPVNRLVARQQPLGYNDWRVPTKGDWDDFFAGVSGGLSGWGKQMQLPQLAGSEVTLHSGGLDRKATVFAPVLVDLEGKGSSFGTYSAASSDANNVTLAKSTDAHELAGRLFLVRDIPDDKPASARSSAKKTR